MQVLKAIAVAAALCGAVIAQARPLEEIQKSGTIVLASEGQYAPFNFFKGKQLTGYEYEVASAAQAMLDGRTECDEMPHSDTLRIMECMDSLRADWGLKYPFEA